MYEIAKALKVDSSPLYDDYLSFSVSDYDYKIRNIRKKLTLNQE